MESLFDVHKHTHVGKMYMYMYVSASLTFLYRASGKAVSP